MQITTTIRSWRAIALAGLFATGTCYVLFQDLLGGAPLNTGHVLTLLALIGATAAGHSLVPLLRERRVALAFGALVVTVAGLFYIVTMSAARNAETSAAKASTITTNNKARAGTEAEIIALKATWTALEAAANAECATGKGKFCDGKRGNADRAKALVEIKEGSLKHLPVAQAANGGYAHVARIWAAIGGGTAETIEQALVLSMPFLAVLITELGTIVFLGMALGHAERASVARAAPALATPAPLELKAELAKVEAPTEASTPAPAPLPPPATLPKPVTPKPQPQPIRTATKPAEIIEHPVLAAINKAGRALSNDELAAAMGVTKGEATKRRQEVADRVIEQRQGRYLMVAVR